MWQYLVTYCFLRQTGNTAVLGVQQHFLINFVISKIWQLDVTLMEMHVVILYTNLYYNNFMLRLQITNPRILHVEKQHLLTGVLLQNMYSETILFLKVLHILICMSNPYTLNHPMIHNSVVVFSQIEQTIVYGDKIAYSNTAVGGKFQQPHVSPKNMLKSRLWHLLSV